MSNSVQDTDDASSSLEAILSSLKIPQDFYLWDKITSEETIARLDVWKTNAEVSLGHLKDFLTSKDVARLPLQTQATIISTTAVFDGDGPWISSFSRELAGDILVLFSDCSTQLLEQILKLDVKPIFISNPHPSLHMDTGRKLPRSAGGPMASQDYYEEQTWKSHPGLANVISWCLRHTPSSTYERIWPLIIPPVMTFLDDYEARYKLLGVLLVSDMLQNLPADLMKRTGVGGLLHTSLLGSLHHLKHPETPDLIRAAVPTTLSLIQATSAPGSSERFNSLCSLCDRIIGGIWLFAYDDLQTLEASVDVLPAIIELLGIGAARYLKALIPQLVHPLSFDRYQKTSSSLQLASLRALGTVMDQCAPRIYKWKSTILNGVGRCWVTLHDNDAAGTNEVNQEFVTALQNVCRQLAKICPSVINEEYRQLVTSDPILFRNLVYQC